LQIPQEYSDKFRDFFSSFDTDLARLQILAYGMTVTTLEDVFMKVGHMADPMEVMEENDENEELREQVYGTQLSRQFSVLNFISIQDLSKAYEAAQQISGDQQGIGHALNLMQNQYNLQQ
jgi:ATP-binding cassette subfamily A (ABC1) protein 3